MGLVFGLYFVYLFAETFFLDNTVFDESKVYVYINEGDEFSDLLTSITPLLNSISSFRIAAQKKAIVNVLNQVNF